MSQSILHIYPGFEKQGGALAAHLGCDTAGIEIHSFPDGESRVKVRPHSGTALIYASLDNPNEKIVRLLFAAETLRSLGAKRVVLVSPYLCYMRQDKAFEPGQAISQKVIGQLLANSFDRIVCVDPHLHRIASLADVFQDIEADALSAAGLIAQELSRDHGLQRAVLVGPDSESFQWVNTIAKLTGQSTLIAEKVRRGDRDVTIRLQGAEQAKNRPAIIVDDMISSGTTALKCARLLAEAGADRVEVIAVHALSGADDLRHLLASGIARVRSTDSVLNPSNAISLAPLLAEALKKEIQIVSSD